MQSNRGNTHLTGWGIAIVFFYSLMAISLVGLTHEHEHTTHCSTDCSACVFSANHVGIELPTADFTNIDPRISTYSPIDFIFISPTWASTVQSRAPPAFSI